MNPKAKGELTQAIVVAALLKRGVSVSVPYGDNQRYDLILDVSGKLLKAQVKTSVYDGVSGKIFFPVCSSYAHRGGKRKSYHGSVNCFLTYSPETRKVYMIPIKRVRTTSMTLRLRPSANNQSVGVNMASDFHLSKVLINLGHTW